MSLRRNLALLSLACALSALPVFAQPEEVEVEVVVDNGEEAYAMDAEMEEETFVAEAETPATYDVWWGNRSISYGNYLKFDRMTAMAAPFAPAVPDRFDTIYFAKDKAAVLSPAARAIIDEAARYLRTDDEARVAIEVAYNGGTVTASQLAVIQRRAEAVRMYLVESGIAADRVTMNTAGEAAVLPPNTAVIPVSAD